MIGGVILAAGEAKRMGTIKQLLDWHGESLISHVVRQTLQSHFDPVRVVLGANREQIEPVLTGLQVEIVHNPDYRQGQSTSVKKGLVGLPEGVTGVAFVLADQPLIRVETFDTLIATFRRERPGILIPTWQGQRGNPVFFHQRFFSLLMEIEGDRGGREIIQQHVNQVQFFEVNDPGILADVDVPEDYLRLLS